MFIAFIDTPSKGTAFIHLILFISFSFKFEHVKVILRENVYNDVTGSLQYVTAARCRKGEKKCHRFDIAARYARSSGRVFIRITLARLCVA